LSCLVKNFNENIYMALRQAGCDLDATSKSGESVLHHACLQGDRNLVGHLLRDGAALNGHSSYDGFTPLHMAASAGHALICQDLVGAGANPNALSTNGRTPLVVAAGEGYKETCMSLIGVGADPTVKFMGKSIWAYANSKKHKEMGNDLKAFLASIKASEAVDAALAKAMAP
jgi:ankyrin repeat protein